MSTLTSARPLLSLVQPDLIGTMHPDTVLLQGHGVTSPRLCSSRNSSLGSGEVMAYSALYAKSRKMQCESPAMSEAGGEHMNSNIDGDSCCSEDSELSVGQEGCESETKNLSNSQNAENDTDQDAASNMSDVHDDYSNDSCQNRELDPTLLMSGAGLQIPVPIVRPSPTRFQEEFLRKSHIYAEELMKQQMQFMAAARASAFSLRQPPSPPSTEIAKMGFRPHIKPPDQTLTNFSGIHNHLSTISKLSSQFNNGESALSKLTAFGMGPTHGEPSHSPSSFQHLPFLNNNLHDSNLKFSIDNILKADFGRRITDPLLKRSGSSSKRNQKDRHRTSTTTSKTKLATLPSNPIDLTPNSTSAASSVCSNSNDSVNSMGMQMKSPPTASPTAATATGTSGTQGAGSGAGAGASTGQSSSTADSSSSGNPIVWPAWVYCTRYSDRPSSGPRTRKPKRSSGEKVAPSPNDEKRPRTAFSGSQLARLKHEFNENRYLTEKRRQQLSNELGLNEAQIKIWFQNKRAKIKKSSGTKNPLALQLMAQGLYNHSTVPLTKEEEELQALQAEAAGSP